MRIITKMLGVHKKQDYVIAEYTSHRGSGIISLMVKVNDYFYDVENHRFIHSGALKCSKNLKDLMDADDILTEKETLSTRKAKKITKEHNYHKQVFEEWKKLNSIDIDLMVEPDYTAFYAVI